VEAELGILSRQCLGRRLGCQTKPAQQVAGGEDEGNEKEVRTPWTFTPAVARLKLRKPYPTIED
jgi:hypothetical protein